jgi:CRISPR/Cas system CSM-associated protein Csm3 (group 7 of RAMP superfamily)
VANLENQEGDSICSLLSEFGLEGMEEQHDKRRYFDICATFSLEGSSLLIRSGFGEADTGPDMVHLHSVDENGNRIPVIPGTSWAGVLRHRALRIVNTILGQTAESQDVVDQMFGHMPKRGQKVGTASRLVVNETPVRNGQSLYQTRVRIDRFTGGALESALFDQAPIYGTAKTEVDFHVHMLDPKDHEKGLLMLLLKDLWTQDLPVGGESSVGRGRLTGLCATITERNGTDEETTISLVQNGNGLGLTSAQQQTLQEYVDGLWQKLKPGEEQSHEQG